MAVRIRFVSGEESLFRDADSVARFETMIVVSKWNTKRRHLDEVAVFPANKVIVVEVSENGVVTNGVFGDRPGQ
jgi:hypothetical protein